MRKLLVLAVVLVMVPVATATVLGSQQADDALPAPGQDPAQDPVTGDLVSAGAAKTAPATTGDSHEVDDSDAPDSPVAPVLQPVQSVTRPLPDPVAEPVEAVTQVATEETSSQGVVPQALREGLAPSISGATDDAEKDASKGRSDARGNDAAQAAAATVVVASQAGAASWLSNWQAMRFDWIREPFWRGAGRLGRGARLVALAVSNLPLLGLFSRIRDDQLAEAPQRRSILDQIQANPGCCIRDIQATQEVAWGTAVYHLKRLEDAGIIVSHRRGRARRYWDAAGAEAPERRRSIVLKSTMPRRFAAAIMAEPGLCQKDLCSRLDVSASVASKHLARLEEAGLVQVHALAQSRYYEPTQLLERMVQLVNDQSQPTPAVHKVAEPILA